MIKELNLADLEKVNSLLSIFNCYLSGEDFNNNKFLKALVFDDVKGVVVFDYIYDRIEIEYIVVDEQYRKKGIATNLLNYIIDKYTDIDNITLEVRESNLPAINFYKKNGFKEVAIREKYYKNENAILMMRESK